MKAYTVEGLRYLLQNSNFQEKEMVEQFLDWLRESELNGKVDEILENEE